MPGPWPLQTVAESTSPPYFMARWGVSDLEVWSVKWSPPPGPDLEPDALVAAMSLPETFIVPPFPYDRYRQQVTLPLDPGGRIDRRSIVYTVPNGQSGNTAQIIVWDWPAASSYVMTRPDASSLVGPMRFGGYLYFAEKSIADGLTRLFRTHLDLEDPSTPATIGAEELGVGTGARFPFEFWVTEDYAVTLRLFSPGSNGAAEAWVWPLIGGAATVVTANVSGISTSRLGYPAAPIPTASTTAFRLASLQAAVALSVTPGVSVDEAPLSWSDASNDGRHVVKPDEDVVILCDSGLGPTRRYDVVDLHTGDTLLPLSLPIYNVDSDPLQTALFPSGW
jgi:hypothetical protein